MRKSLSMTLTLFLVATIGLSACAEKKPESKPPPSSANSADNVVPAAPTRPAVPAGGPSY